MKTKSFEQWMKEVDQQIAAILFGMNSNDLPDVCYSDMHEDGLSPRQAAKRAMKNAQE